MKINIPKKIVLFVLPRDGGNIMKKQNERLDFPISTWVSFDVKSKIYRIADDANITVSEVIRRLLEKAIAEYMED